MKGKTLAMTCIVVLFAVLLLSGFSHAVPQPTAEFYVNDYAGVLDQSTRAHILRSGRELQSKSGAQIVVCTVKSLDGMTVEDYTDEMFRKFKIGDQKKNNGMLILIFTENPKMRIEVGDGLAEVIPREVNQRIQSQARPLLYEKKWNEGITVLYDGYLAEICQAYGLSLPQRTAAQEDQPAKQAETTGLSLSFYQIAHFFSIDGTGGQLLVLGIFVAFGSYFAVKMIKSNKDGEDS